MSLRLALLHTVTSLVGLFNDLCTDILTADGGVFHIADKVLLKVALDQGGKVSEP